MFCQEPQITQSYNDRLSLARNALNATASQVILGGSSTDNVSYLIRTQAHLRIATPHIAQDSEVLRAMADYDLNSSQTDFQSMVTSKLENFANSLNKDFTAIPCVILMT